MRVIVTLTGQNYNSATFIAAIRNALNVPASVLVRVLGTTGSVVATVAFSSTDSNAANGAASDLIGQANTAGSNLRNLYPSIQSANLEGLSTAPPTDGGGGGLADGAIAGIVIGVVLGLCMIATAVWYFCFRKKSSDDDDEERPRQSFPCCCYYEDDSRPRRSFPCCCYHKDDSEGGDERPRKSFPLCCFRKKRPPPQDPSGDLPPTEPHAITAEGEPNAETGPVNAPTDVPAAASSTPAPPVAPSVTPAVPPAAPPAVSRTPGVPLPRGNPRSALGVPKARKDPRPPAPPLEFQLEDAVLGEYEGEWHECHIHEVREDTYVVRWDETPESGDVLRPDQVKARPEFEYKYAKGQQVTALWVEDGSWYPGTIDELEPGGTYHVDWGDGTGTAGVLEKNILPP